MFCPGCAIQVVDDTKFCKACGANLRGVREAMAGRGEQFDWSKTWVAEMFLTEEEKERRRGVTPADKRNNEIKAGVITTLASLGAIIFLRFFLEAVTNNESGGEAEIIRRVWMIGIVPFLVGIGYEILQMSTFALDLSLRYAVVRYDTDGIDESLHNASFQVGFTWY